MVGRSASVCNTSGSWSEPVPICQAINCPANPTAPVNGVVATGDRKAFTTRTYSCNTGYQLSGATTTVCQTTGTWSATPPTCTRVLCSIQVAPSNGAIASLSLEIYGAAIFTCNSGYNVVGSSASVCLPNGAWSITPPTCQRVQCPSILASPLFGSVLPGSNEVFNSRQFKCHPGYQLEGSSHTICLSTGAWSQPTPKCKRVLCSGQVAPLNGAIASMSLEINGATIFICNSGYNVSGSSASVCLPNGTWSSSPPICQRITCPTSVPTPSFGTVTTGINEVFSSRKCFLQQSSCSYEWFDCYGVFGD
ncbi:E-selectin-like [Sycon ciliatum]|uniref:E-selectin-like n=1 Tax=Sycon ciliatum TaxID=27933 RepID=UPI0031F66DC3